MRVELLGTGGYYANDIRQTACTLFPEWGLVFDAGSALFRTAGRIPSRNMQLFVTHPHVDHIVGVPYLLLPLLMQQLDSVTLHATAETLAAIQTHLLSQPLFPVEIPFQLVEIGERGEREIAPQVTVRWQRLPSHPGGSMAFRVDDRSGQQPVSVSYVTDTNVDGSYTDFIRHSDLLIHECYFPDAQADLARRSGHSVASDVARLAKDSLVGRLVLVHPDPSSPLADPIGLPGMRAVFHHIELGTDGMCLDVMPS